ncbi:MAG: response regulator [Rhodobacterales bacterium]|jgi:two-component system, NtrC family, C4-dicarboxylate transport response regulator DctD
MTNSVLLVDDDAAVREALGQTLELAGLQPILASSFISARDHISPAFEGVVVSDIRMQGKDGFALLAFAQEIDVDLPVVLLTGEGDVRMAVRSMSAGAFDFLEKPCDPKHFTEVVEKALKTRALVLENRRLKAQLDQAQHEKIGFLGVSSAAKRLREAIRRASRVATPVLICGEPGTGRGHVARLIEDLRGSGTIFKRFDCISPMDWGAAQQSLGLETILFCDVERLDVADQARLARFLTEHPNAPVYATGGSALEAEFQARRFNDTLFYALGVVRINVPPLAERTEDIPILFDKFLREEIDAGAYVTSMEGQAATRGLASLEWSGNLRALRNHAKRVAWGLNEQQVDASLKAQLERVERGILQDTLKRHNGNATEAALALGLPRKTLYDRMARLGIRPENFR